MKWILIVCAALLAAGAQAQSDPTPKDKSAPKVGAIDVKKGDQWVYEIRDGLTDALKYTATYTISNVADDEIDVRLKTKVARTNVEGVALETFDRRWRKMESAKFTFKKRQETWGVPDDLSVGKEWSYEYETHSIDSAAYSRWAGHGEVLAWEKVTLPSGQSYDAFRIEFHEALARNAGSQSEATSSSRKIGADVVEWYAPSVNRYVKRTIESLQNGKTMDSDNEVLIGYSPHGTE